MAASHVIETQSVETEREERQDWAGIIGILLAAAAVPCTLFGIMMPLIPWIVSGVLGLAILACGVFALPPLRRWVLLVGFLCLIPPVILLLVQALPTLLISVSNRS